MTTATTTAAAIRLQESPLSPDTATRRHRQPAGEPWFTTLRAGRAPTVKEQPRRGKRCA